MTAEQIDKIFSVTNSFPRANIIIFESMPIFSDNTYWFFHYLVKNTSVAKKYKLVWMVNDRTQFRDELCGVKIKCIARDQSNAKEKAEYLYYYNFAKFIIDCNSYVYKKNAKQKRIYLGHGMPVKIAAEYLSEQGETDLNTFTSYFFKDFYMNSGFKESEICNFGYCRNDILAENFGKRKNREVTNIVWMPTYRQHSNAKNMAIENRFPLGLPVLKSHEDIVKINEYLKKNNTVLYLRPHPAQDTSILHIEEMSNIVIADNDYLNKRNMQLYEFLTETDALITDYSSVYYDYLLLGRPIALMIEDIEEFQTKWKLYFDDYKGNMKCPYLDTVADFEKFIEDTASDNDAYEEERIKARDRFNDYHDGKNCERLYHYMVREYKL